uniref:Diguanylate phosphodiesterase n=1 Tax=Shewanella sp. (strain MR-7) TaxID=60481 RepID=Q0HR83_SHESR
MVYGFIVSYRSERYMNKCYLLKAKGLNDSYIYSLKLNFKYQNIFMASRKALTNPQDTILGAELLIDFSRMNHAGVCHDILDKIVRFGQAANKALDYTKVLSRKSRVFINIERCNLCDIRLLNRIAHISDELFLQDIVLVVEITERNFCGRCLRIVEGLSYLKGRGVSLAIDDYDYHNWSPEIHSVELELFFDYIKLEYPSTAKGKLKFDQFIKFYSNTKRLVVERVSERTQLESLDCEKIWGIQGFLLCRGVSLPRLPQ